MAKRLIILIVSIALAILAVWGLGQISWSPFSAYPAYAVLAIIFLGILISNQQYEEDSYSKIERVTSAFLLSYLVFFRFFYAPLSQFFFGNLIIQQSFFSDVLSLVLFMIFFFLFGTAFLVVNTYSRVGFLSNWRIFNNEKMFFILRALMIPVLAVFLLFYLRNSFFSIKNSDYMNSILPPSTCNWTYVEYQNFLSTGRSVAGRDVCLYNFALNQKNSKYCDLINDSSAKTLCVKYFILNSRK